jgi:hypothetical protein
VKTALALLIVWAVMLQSVHPQRCANAEGTQPLTGISLAKSTGSFYLSGDIVGLYPGIKAPLVISITNPNPFPIVVDWISVKPLDANPGCIRKLVRAIGWSTPILVEGGGTRQVTTHIHMRPRAPDACQGATFPLIYKGLADLA